MKMTRASMERVWRINYNVRLLFKRVLLLENIVYVHHVFTDPRVLWSLDGYKFNQNLKRLYYARLNQCINAVKRMYSAPLNTRTISQ